MTHILYDQAIPFIHTSFARHATCVPYEAGSISQEQLLKADILLVRSVTNVSRSMLENSSLSAVGSMTAGMDHLDMSALSELGIAWHHAAGANARAVAEYVTSVLAYLDTQGRVDQKKLGLIGCGEVGSRVTHLAEGLGWHVVAYDPPKEKREPVFKSAAWEEILACSTVCCCVPLITEGQWPTQHMIDASVLEALPDNAIVINVGRGGVLDESAFLSQTKINCCCDVWEREPSVNANMVQRAMLSTPHIAGYSKQAKANLTWQVYEAIAKQFGWNDLAPRLYQSVESVLTDNDSVLTHYNPSQTSKHMKHEYQRTDAQRFRQLRSSYVFRSEWGEK